MVRFYPFLALKLDRHDDIGEVAGDFNGFTMLELDADNLTETFHDELGRVAWTPEKGGNRG